MINRFYAAASVAALLGVAAAPTAAQAPAAAGDPAILFGAREGVEDISLSPGGTRIAFLAPGPGQGNLLFIADAAGGSAPVVALRASGDPERISDCGWVSDTRLVCDVYMLQQISG